MINDTTQTFSTFTFEIIDSNSNTLIHESKKILDIKATTYNLFLNIDYIPANDREQFIKDLSNITEISEIKSLLSQAGFVNVYQN